MPRPLRLVMGTVKWLDATKDIHKGHGGSEFVKLVGMLGKPQDGFIRVTKQGIADLYGVHRHTFQEWLDGYNKEHETNNDRPSV
jgi:hypothetical protein